jgi:4-hydroxyphenylpyruvate dioxygenase
MRTTTHNPVGLNGIDFLELASPEPENVRSLLRDFGFARTMCHRERAIDLYEQNDITILVNAEPRSFAASFTELHGPSVPAMGWRVENGARAYAEAIRRGARPAVETDLDLPAVVGIGDSLLYLIDRPGAARWKGLGFVPHTSPDARRAKGFLRIDHLTNNVEKGTLDRWAAFYKTIFGFTEVRTFDIRGKKTGLTSYALRSPCGKFCIPINQADEQKSQINEYLAEYRGPGVQHVAFLAEDLLASLGAMAGTSVEFLDIEPSYYDEVSLRVPQMKEFTKEKQTLIQKRNVLVDGDESGYLLQIFTKNVMGPVFIELIERQNHLSFGEGNFGALFRSIERDQARRGVFRDEVSSS